MMKRSRKTRTLRLAISLLIIFVLLSSGPLTLAASAGALADTRIDWASILNADLSAYNATGSPALKLLEDEELALERTDEELPATYITDRFIIKYKDASTARSMKSTLQAHSLVAAVDTAELPATALIKTESAMSVDELRSQLDLTTSRSISSAAVSA